MKKVISEEEARGALLDIEIVDAKAKNARIYSMAAIPLIVGGATWIFNHGIVYLYQQFGYRIFGLHPAIVTIGAAILCLLSITIYVSLKMRYNSLVRAGGTWFERNRGPLFAVFWVLSVFGIAALDLFRTARQAEVFMAVYCMLLFLIFGFWTMSRLFLVIGCLVIVLAIAGYFLPEDYYRLWMSLICGGTLLGGGVYSYLRYKLKDNIGNSD